MTEDKKAKLLKELWRLLGSSHRELEIGENLVIVKGFVRDLEKYQQKLTALDNEFPHSAGAD